LNSLNGGTGHDTLTARLEAVAISHFLDVSNVLNGGSGNDSLEAFLSADARPLQEARAENHLNGGSGDDRLKATVAPGSIGTSFLSGGAGNDELTAIGGSGNVLDGGSGRDTFTGSIGNDRFVGGGGVDTYRLDPTSNEGTDTFADFAFASDIFSVAGLTDEGAAGLADDLDILSTFSDLGLGNDVIVTFNAGTEFVLKGLGTGAVDSWTKLVSDQSAQLLVASA
jgi:Ca2+-binding RTX toxin-like protein